MSLVCPGEKVYVKVGELKSIFTEVPHRISISNPEIADVTSATKEEVLIMGKSPGNTIINIWDKWGKQKIDVDVYLEDLPSLKERMEKLLQAAGITDVALKINRDEKKIFASGNVEERQKDHLDLLISPFKDKLINLIRFTDAKKSVLIDVNILELDKSASDNLGIDWASAFDFTGSGVTGVPFQDMFKIDTWTRDSISNTINFLVTSGNGKVLSRPKLVCLSGEEAELVVGGEVPIVTTVAHDEGTSVNVEYKKYGIILKIKPVVEEEDGIRISLSTEVSEIDKSNPVIAAGVSIPAFLTREASTEVFIKGGQTIFLAGLLKNKDSKALSRVPGIGDIPVIGHLFRSRDFTTEQTELVITITPTIIDKEEPSRFISEPGEEIGNKVIVENIEEDIETAKEQVVQKEEPVLSKEERERRLIEELKVPINNYAQSVQKAIYDQFIYPEEAVKRNESGTVVLSLYILADGSISDVVLSSSSGVESLDVSAMQLVRNITSLEPFPSNMPLKDLWINIPIKYHLD